MKSEGNQILLSPKGDTINILEGKALEPKHPEKLIIKGQIDSVNKYLAARKGTAQPHGALQHIDRDLAVITVNEEEMTIFLDVDPSHPFGTEVLGKLEFNPDLLQFQINSKNKFSRESLVDLFRMNRRFFDDRVQNENVVAAFQRLSISTNTNQTGASDTRGNRENSFKKDVDSRNVPQEFVLNLPIFKGQPPRKFRVEIGVDATDAGVKFWLESVELIEITDEDKKAIINAQLADYLDFAIIFK